MNWLQSAYPRGRREYIDVYGDFQTITVQDVLDKINNRSGDKAPFEKYFTLRNHHRFLDSDKCKQFLELYDNKIIMTKISDPKSPNTQDKIYEEDKNATKRHSDNLENKLKEIISEVGSPDELIKLIATSVPDLKVEDEEGGRHDSPLPPTWKWARETPGGQAFEIK